MNKIEIHKQINSLLEQLMSNNNALKAKESKLHPLEIESIRLKCIELYDQILLLLSAENENQAQINDVKESNSEIEAKSTQIEEILESEIQLEIQPVSHPKSTDSPKNVEEQVLVTVFPVDEIITNPVDDDEIIIDDESLDLGMDEEIREEPKIEKIEAIKAESNSTRFVPIVEKPIPIYTAPPKIKNEEQSVLEKISGKPSDKSIHDKLTMQNDEKALFEKFSNSKLNKITSAIDISKRFELQNNLFGGDSQSYSKSILSLEEADSKFTALQVFDDLATKLKWDIDNDLVQELKSFIYRKY